MANGNQTSESKWMKGKVSKHNWPSLSYSFLFLCLCLFLTGFKIHLFIEHICSSNNETNISVSKLAVKTVSKTNHIHFKWQRFSRYKYVTENLISWSCALHFGLNVWNGCVLICFSVFAALLKTYTRTHTCRWMNGWALGNRCLQFVCCVVGWMLCANSFIWMRLPFSDYN